MASGSTVQDSIERAVLIAADPARVWALVSIPGWWINDGSRIDLELVEWTAEDRAVVHHPVHGDFTVERFDVDEQRAVSFRWLVSTAPDRRADGPESRTLRTRVDFRLEPTPDGTRLTVVESGFASPEIDEAARRTAYEGNSEGWAIEMELAKQEIESR